ncbi:DsbA family protein [Mycetocola spongiae]|uniref:DsbA family protein n=1 Tax=Mycetocola spongiae TaxID=2859226 RepID=UPI001CF1151C|nr:thioredoxin domain-containing protein [Mycetocola spongiae]UCR89847.1 DsbA family protein [Mycetocola spongiae]
MTMSPARTPHIARQLRRGGVLLAAAALALGLSGCGASTPEPAASPAGAAPAAPVEMRVGAEPGAAGVPDVEIYADYACHWCAAMDIAVSDYLDRAVADDAISLRYHPVAILGGADSLSRNGVAVAGCVADADVTAFPAFHNAMFHAQDPDNMRDIPVSEMLTFAENAGVLDMDGVRSCVQAGTYLPWAEAQAELARTQPLPGTGSPLKSVPTILVNGEAYSGSPLEVNELRAFIESHAS